MATYGIFVDGVLQTFRTTKADADKAAGVLRIRTKKTVTVKRLEDK
jgi:hypothetical protein